jgi:hypothetical protein
MAIATLTLLITEEAAVQRFFGPGLPAGQVAGVPPPITNRSHSNEIDKRKFQYETVAQARKTIILQPYTVTSAGWIALKKRTVRGRA